MRKITLYTFNELTTNAKHKATEKFAYDASIKIDIAEHDYFFGRSGRRGGGSNGYFPGRVEYAFNKIGTVSILHQAGAIGDNGAGIEPREIVNKGLFRRSLGIADEMKADFVSVAVVHTLHDTPGLRSPV